MPSPPVPPPAPPLVWALIVYAWVANYLIRMALSPLLPLIMAELSLSYTKAGLLATAFFYAYLAMQLPAGLLGDRLGRKRVLLSGILLGAAASVLTGLAGSFRMLFLARLLTGLSQGSLFSNDRVIIAAYTPREKMALGQGVSFSGPGLGTTLGLLLAGALGELMPWRGVFVLFAVPPILAAFLLWRFVPEPPPAEVDGGGGAIRGVIRHPAVWILGAAGILPAYIQFVLATWAPLMFAEIGVTGLGRSAFYASLQGLPAPFGLLVMGWLADRVHRRGISRTAVIALTVLLAGGAFAGVGLVLQTGGSPELLVVLILVTSFFFWGTWGPVYAILGERVPPSLLSTAFGILNTLVFIGAVVGPILTGWIKDITGSFALACYAAAIGAGLGALLLLVAGPAFRPRSGRSVAGAEERQV
ncbi:MAG: MFS transporter [Candidatus Rokubacteria bacterium]|nr:MFS transporter [Candidatus Rokubacteria bacterium]